ncbi:hypothetical protein V6N13_052984 [Hibiscus sabdariffa]
MIGRGGPRTEEMLFIGSGVSIVTHSGPIDRKSLQMVKSTKGESAGLASLQMGCSTTFWSLVELGSDSPKCLEA